LAVAAPGCDVPESMNLTLYERLQDENPSVRIKAILEAGDRKDPKAVPFLVDRLSDNARDVRMFAILALAKTTGTRMDYRYYDPPARRAEAVKRWRKWLAAGRPKLPKPSPAGNSAT